MSSLVFLKLGGSVITDKDQPNSAKIERINGIANEIVRALRDNTELSLLIGHGSGSFGHFAAKKYGTRDGVATPQGWQGFAEVALRARELNQIVTERLVLAGLHAVSFSPLSSIQTEDHEVLTWDTSELELALQNHLIPVIYGDVILDRRLGGTILSTEELFAWLAPKLRPNRILLAGLEEGVWKDFPEKTKLLSEIHPADFLATGSGIQASASTDVTGGMRSKVEDMIKLIDQLPDLEIEIFSAVQSGNVFSALRGTQKGTRIRNAKG